MCFSFNTDTRFAAFSFGVSPSTLMPAPFGFGVKDLNTFVGEAFKPTVLVSTPMSAALHTLISCCAALRMPGTDHVSWGVQLLDAGQNTREFDLEFFIAVLKRTLYDRVISLQLEVLHIGNLRDAKLLCDLQGLPAPGIAVDGLSACKDQVEGADCLDALPQPHWRLPRCRSRRVLYRITGLHHLHPLQGIL